MEQGKFLLAASEKQLSLHILPYPYRGKDIWEVAEQRLGENKQWVKEVKYKTQRKPYRETCGLFKTNQTKKPTLHKKNLQTNQHPRKNRSGAWHCQEEYRAKFQQEWNEGKQDSFLKCVSNVISMMHFMNECSFWSLQNTVQKWRLSMKNVSLELQRSYCHSSWQHYAWNAFP